MQIRQFNPDLPIYVLFGGSKGDEKKFRWTLAPYWDDFYCSPWTSTTQKWRHGDLMLLEWFKSKGKKLKWDTIFLAQWDMLVFTSFKKLLPGLRKNQIFFSGHRPLDQLTEENWGWTSVGSCYRDDFLRFKGHISNQYNFCGQLDCCLFIFNAIPRRFFEQYSKHPKKKIGFLEYKLPSLARIMGIPIYKRDIGVDWWGGGEQRPLNAFPCEIPATYIRKELRSKSGWRIFHPYYGLWSRKFR